MSRIANKPIPLPKGVEIQQAGQHLTVKGGKGSLELDLPEGVSLNIEEAEAKIEAAAADKIAIAGTMRSLVNNMVVGVSDGFERKLELVGVGYRAQAQGKTLNLTLGFSHPVNHALPEGITVETPSQTEILVKGIDKQLVGQVSADIRAYRPPEPYKGKGVRYADERVVRKEAKKK
ncbi:MAG: 50S ribosomal protein L6 [Nevskiales bacterium]